MSLQVVILAAGQGTRMKSSRPKVLHELAGRPMLKHVVDTASSLGADTIHVVIGHGGDLIKQSLPDIPVSWVEQKQRLGTGHAVQQSLPELRQSGTVLILYGDVPLISPETLQEVLADRDENGLSLLTISMQDSTGYGRIVRNHSGLVSEIVEDKDASAEQRKIHEINTGIMAVPAAKLHQWLPQLSADNAQGEYYLTDLIALAYGDGSTINAVTAASEMEVYGVNSRAQLAELERYYQASVAQSLMDSGVTLFDPARIDVRGQLEVGQDTTIDVNLVCEGKVVIGKNVVIGPNVLLKDSLIEDGAVILANSIVEDSLVAEGCSIGPFARLRLGTKLAKGAKIGNFVETKKAIIGKGSKINHLSYVGDTVLGENVNVGAGTITCNYDGANKHQTTIGDDVFVGSNTALVAPVTIEEGATIGAGSTICKDVQKNTLAITRSPQKAINGWERPVKRNK